MAITHTAILRDGTDYDLHDAKRLEVQEATVWALTEEGSIVALFPLASLTAIVEKRETGDGDGESADEDRASVYNIMNFSPAYPPLMKTA